MRQLTALTLLLVAGPALADGLVPLDNESLGESRVEAPMLLADESSEADIHENVRQQQLNLPDAESPAARPALVLPPVDTGLTGAQRQFADNLFQGIENAASGAP